MDGLTFFFLMASKNHRCLVQHSYRCTVGHCLLHHAIYTARSSCPTDTADTVTATFFYFYPSQPYGKMGLVFFFHFQRKGECNLFSTLFQLSAVWKTAGPVFCALKPCVSLSIQRENMFEGKIAPGMHTDVQHFVFHICFSSNVWRNIYIRFERKVPS